MAPMEVICRMLTYCMFHKVLNLREPQYLSKRLLCRREMADTPGRPMKFPYTFTAKAAQFPYKFFFSNSWIAKYTLFGILLSAPLFYKIGKMSYSPENVAKWDKVRRENFTPHHHD